MTRVPDRKKQRREYLKKKGKAYILGISGATLYLPAISIACCFVFGTMFGLSALLFAGGGWSALVFSLVCIIAAVLCSRFAHGCDRLRAELREAAEFPYVPPVTADTLPAEEVLVRSAEEPQTGSETLVRPSAATGEAPAQELLRSSQGQQ